MKPGNCAQTSRPLDFECNRDFSSTVNIGDVTIANQREPLMGFRLALIAVVLTLSLSPSTAQTIADRMQRVVQPYVDAQMFMGSVLAAKDGKVIFTEVRDGGLGVERSQFPHY
jgi:hypothetical protein